MKKSILLSFALMCVVTLSNAQTNAMQFTGTSCNGNAVDIFADLDAGKAVILHFFMPNCGSCPPPAQKIQAMANNINAMYPGMVKGYAFPFQNSTTCAYTSSWVSQYNLSALYEPVDKGATQVAYYGGFGMPTVVLLGGTDHRVMFSTLSFSTSDTTEMRDSILAMLASTSFNDLPASVTAFNVFPNPANDVISVNINLKESAELQIDITDMEGKQVATIAKEKLNAGASTKQFNTSSLPNGNYFVRLQVNGKGTMEKISIKH